MFHAHQLSLPEALWIEQRPDPSPDPTLFAWNAPLADELGLALDRTRARDIFSGGELPAGTRSVAQAYAGHQFGHFVPQLGDGRAVLLGERVNAAGERVDIQLKGSGRTPFSRGGDGKSALGPVIREYLLSEAMHQLGVPTTRALAAVTTGETVLREQPQPGGVLTRVARSHLRVGTFEYLAARGDRTALAQLVDAVIERHYPKAASEPAPVMALFAMIARAQAQLVAHWMALGFVHGVMNTDNTTLSGETIDYGPCAFLDEFHREKVFSSIDRYGRYAYGQQPLIATWNLSRLGGCLMLVEEDQAGYEAILESVDGTYRAHYHQRMAGRLGMGSMGREDLAWLDQWLDALQSDQRDYTLSFHELASSLDSDAPTDTLTGRWRDRVLRDGRDPRDVQCDMATHNPSVIPRNHQVERAIAAANRGDFSVFESLHRVLSKPYDLRPEDRAYAEPPLPEERVTQTFCGT